MKTMSWKVLGAVALLAGCGGSGVMSLGTPEADPDADPVVTSSSDALRVDVRLRGAGTRDFQSLQVLADDVRVIADGVPLAVTPTGTPAELTNELQAWRLGTVQVPADAKVLEIAVQLAPAGVFDRGRGLGYVDATATTLRFRASLENVAKNGKAVVVLNAAKSLVARGEDTVALVPNFRVEY